VKKNQLTKAVLAALVLASSSVLAGSDYPAADFQPKVVFSDPSAASASASKPAAAAPAAAQVEEADPNFPATNFQPKVLYSDADYKHSSAAPSAAAGSSKSSASSSSASSVSAAPEVQAEKPASDNTNLIGLIALAAVGFYFYNKQSGGKASAKTAAADEYVASAGGATGVEKYLEKIGANKTGVAKYLEKQTENPKTGVAKYVAKQVVRDRESAAARATGVEKYLREKG